MKTVLDNERRSTKKMKNVLFMAYYYPPLGGMGSQRSQKFVRYLPEFGWQPIVVAPERTAYLVDASLDDGTSRGVEIFRTNSVDLSSMFKRLVPKRGSSNGHHQTAEDAGDSQGIPDGSVVSFLKRAVRTCAYIPDAQIGWFPYAVRAGKRILETHNIDAIYSSSAPVTAHLAAYRLKVASNKPWIADFRDLWTENHYADYSSSFRKRLDQIIESKLLEKADVLLTVSDTWAETLRKLTGGRKRVEVIRNGFDSTEFAGIVPKKLDKWTITYVGLFYGVKQDPSPFLEALRRILESGKVRREDVRLNIVGEPDVFVKQLIADFYLDDLTYFTGFLPHGEALTHQVNSSLLLLIVHRDRGNAGHIPGKLYEYLGSHRPILALAPPDFEVSHIIRETGGGVAIEATDNKGIEEALLDSYLAYRSGSNDGHKANGLHIYERKVGASQLATMLTEVAGTRV